MWLGLVQSLLETPEVEYNVEHLMRCLLHIIDSRFINSQVGVLVYSAGNSFGPSLLNANIKKIHEIKRFPIIYGIVDFRLHSSFDFVIVFVNKDNLSYLMSFLFAIMVYSYSKSDKNFIIVTSYKTSNYKSATNYAMDILQVTWKFSKGEELIYGGRFANTIVMIGRYDPNTNETTSIDVFGWIPQEQTDPCVKSISKIKLLDTWISFNNSFINNVDLFPNKQINNFRGCNMIIQMHSLEYAFLILNNENFDPTASSGYSVMKEISRFSKFNISTIMNVNRNIYFYTVYGLHEIAILFTYDRIIADSGHIPPILNVFDPIFLQNDRLKFFVPLGAPIPYWKGLVRVFSLQLWILVITVYFLISIIYFFLKSPELKDSMITSFLYTLQMSLGMSVSLNTKSRFLLALMILFIFYYMVICTIYRASLIGFLLKPGRQNPISSLKELEGSKLEIASILEASSIECHCPEINSTYMGRKILPADGYNINRLVCEGDLAVLATDSYMQFALSYKDIIQCEPQYKELDVYFPNMLNILTVTKGSLYEHRIKELFKKLVVSGLVNKWHRDNLLNNSKIFNERNIQNIQKISLKHLQGAFYILFIGELISFIAFVAEFLLEKIKSIIK